MVSEATWVDKRGKERHVVAKPWLPARGGEECALICWSCASELCLCVGVTVPGGTELQ